MCINSPDMRFTGLGTPRRVWAISSIHGELEKLYALHDAVLERLQAGDRIIYLGNFTGYGQKSRETVDEILTFRRLALAQPGMMPSDIIYLRGRQEDMWQKLLQIQFANKPENSLQLMLDAGLAPTLESYGINADDGMRACKEGVLALTRWTMKIRAAICAHSAHDVFMRQHRRAAYTAENGQYCALFVNAGLNPALKLEDQGESLWSAGEDFFQITKAYEPFEKVIRGYDPLHTGVRLNCVTASIDGGSGFGGNLVCAQLDYRGQIHELLQA